jgi:hypothetical protein
MRRLLSFCVVALTIGIVTGLVATPSASAQQSFNLFVGGFTPHSLDARGSNDVLFQNGAFLSTLNRDSGIDISEFNGATLGGEYLVALGRNLEAGLGLGFYQKTVPTVFTDLVNANGTDIQQELKLRIIPFTATVRFLPLGERNPIQPYIGAGVGVYAWRYSETGQFVDQSNNIFTDSFVASGSKAGPVVLGGVRFGAGPIGVGGEIRWQNATANLPTDKGFAHAPNQNPQIDLGGMSYLFIVNFRF